MPFTPPLFDRFSPDGNDGLDGVARDIADIIGARRAFPGRAAGVLNWGLPGMVGMTPSSEADRVRIAALIREALGQFEPRLEGVSVTPIEDTADFAFALEAFLVSSDDQSLKLRILSPRRGGGLGADVVIMGNTVTVIDRSEGGGGQGAGEDG